MTYLHTDHLGSVSAATSSSGAVVNTQSYKPWGEVRTGDIPQTTRDFTGQRRDGTGLLHYNARYYDAGLGLFLSPDTIVPGTASGAGGAAATVGPDARAGLAALTVGFHEPQFNAALGQAHRALLGAGFFGRETPPSAGPANPQALNRYAYVLNNPVRYTDPTGHSACAMTSHPGLRLACHGVEFVAWAATILGAAAVVSCIVDNQCNGVSSALDLATRTNLAGTTPIDQIGELDARHLDAAYREANGEVVARKPDGTAFDHRPEVQQGINRLDKRLAALRRRLAYAEGFGHDKVSDEEREAIRDEIVRGDRLRQRAVDAKEGRMNV